MDKKKKMKHKLVELGFFLLFLGLVLFILATNFISANPNPASHISWSLVGFVSSVSLFTGALILSIKLLAFLVDKVHPPRVQS
jgi:hypothetical protein